MRALTKKDIALIRGGVNSGGGYSSLETRLMDAFVESRIAASNIAYDEAALVDDALELSNDYIALAGDLLSGDAIGLLLDSAKQDADMIQQATDQNNLGQNEESYQGWTQVVAALEADIAALGH